MLTLGGKILKHPAFTGQLEVPVHWHPRFSVVLVPGQTHRPLYEFAASVSERALTSAREGLDGLVLPCSYACACTTFGFLAGLGWLGIAGAELDL
jgi:hypothetical protein